MEFTKTTLEGAYLVKPRVFQDNRGFFLESYSKKRFEEQETTIGNCKCGGKLKIIYSRKTHKRFVGCTNYPECNVSFPLPQKGKIEILKKIHNHKQKKI